MSAVEALQAALRSRLDPRISVHAAALDAAVPPLFPEEAPYEAPAVERRKQELRVGRHLARAALADVGARPGPLLRREDRSVIWPDGYMGSISHTKDVVVAAAARSSEVACLGLDVERTQVSPRLVDRIMRDEERAALPALSKDALCQRATRVFSAKEAFYKAQYPHTETYLGFHDVLLELEPDGSAVCRVVRPDSPLLGLRLAGFWLESGSWVASGFLAEAPPSS